MTAARSFEKTLHMEAERLCLEFANTVNWHASAQPVEEIRSYDELVQWAQRVGLLVEAEARRLRKTAGSDPAAAERTLARAREVREAIYRVFSAQAHHRRPDPADVEILTAGLAEALSHARLRPAPEGFRWDWDASPQALDQMLWPILQSAVDLLTAPELSRVGECADDRGCGWLFVDMTKNHSRRWCAMDDCGNRAKAQRHYARKARSARRTQV